MFSITQNKQALKMYRIVQLLIPSIHPTAMLQTHFEAHHNTSSPSIITSCSSAQQYPNGLMMTISYCVDQMKI